MKNSNSILISILVLILQFFPNLTKAQDEITFGNQTWTLRNLNVEKFRNGDNIQEVKSKEDWVRLYESKQPAWCYYDFDKSNESKYGKLYNWYAIKDHRGLAPLGWHIPNQNEWNELVEYFKSSNFTIPVTSKTIEKSKNWSKPKVTYGKNWELNLKDKNNNFWLGQLGGSMYVSDDVTGMSKVRFEEKGISAKWWVLDAYMIGITSDKSNTLVKPGWYGVSDIDENDHSGAYSIRLIKD